VRPARSSPSAAHPQPPAEACFSFNPQLPQLTAGLTGWRFEHGREFRYLLVEPRAAVELKAVEPLPGSPPHRQTIADLKLTDYLAGLLMNERTSNRSKKSGANSVKSGLPIACSTLHAITFCWVILLALLSFRSVTTSPVRPLVRRPGCRAARGSPRGRRTRRSPRGSWSSAPRPSTAGSRPSGRPR
jgi:hypothetical protein